jgi:carboxyl-terminal processing protease
MKTNYRLPAIFLTLFAAALLLSQLDIRDGYSLTSDWFGKGDRLARLDTLGRVLYHIQESYVDPERVKPKAMFEKALDNLSGAVAEVRVLHPSPKKAVLLVDQERKEFDTDLPTAFALKSSLSDALRFVRANKRSEISDTDLETAAINGILSTLDPHSIFLTKEMFKEMTTANTGMFGGLGIEIGIRDTKLTVLRPLKDTPASRAGLLAGDHITRIGEDSTRNMGLDEAVDRLRGPKGTKVTMSILRGGWAKERDFTLTRAEINVASIESAILPNRTAYLRIKSFQRNTARDLDAHLRRLHQEAGAPLRGLILDLRNDPGGLLDQAISVTDRFLSEGVIVTTVDMNTKARKQEKAVAKGTEPDYPMVVLVNGSSASASEIVAGALQRQGRAILVGEKTFGKGTVQSIFEFPEKSALKLTVAKYYTPGDISIQSIGISPEIRLMPALVSADRLDIFPNHSRISEKSLDRHFDNPQNVPAQFEPLVSLRYFEPRTDRELIDDETRLNASKEDPKAFVDALLKSAILELASDILSRTSGSRRDLLLAAAKQSAAWMDKRETSKIEAALGKQRIDWSPAPDEKPLRCGTPVASSRIVEPGPSKAGETVRLAVTVTNPGPCRMSQTWGSSSSKNYLFDDHEFLFGKIPPGGSVTREVRIEIPAFSPTSLSRVSFQFKEARGIAPEKLRTMIPIQRAELPKFGFHFDLRDIPKPGRGEANGLMEPGETAELRVRIRNVGAAPATEGVASISQEGEKKVQFRRTHIPLSVIAPKGSATALFRMEIPSSFGDDSFETSLTIADVKTRVFLTQTLRFRVVPRRKSLPGNPRTVTGIAPSIAVHALADAGSPLLARVPRGIPLQTSGLFEGFSRVRLTREISGWVKTQDVSEAASRGAERKKKEEIDWVYLESPEIRTDLEKRAFQPLDPQFLSLEGRIDGGERAKDLLVFVNQKKVYYRNFDEPGSDRKEAKFSAAIPLEPGTNRLLLVARDRNDLTQKEAVILQRSGMEEDEGEDRNEELDDFLFSPGE